MAETKAQRRMRETLEKIATMPLSMDFEYDQFGEIKSGSRAYGPGWAAWHFQQIARAAVSNGHRDD